MKIKKILYILGHWMGIETYTCLEKYGMLPGTFLDLTGLSFKQRVERVAYHLSRNQYDVIIGFSSGDTVLRMIEDKARREGRQIIPPQTKLLYLPPGPEAGVGFRLTDSTFWKICKYMLHLIFLKKFQLSIKDRKELFAGDGPVEELIRTLVPDSTKLAWSQIFRQFLLFRPQPVNFNRAAIASTNDPLLGSTQERSLRSIHPHQTLQAKLSGHFGPLFELEESLTELFPEDF